MKLALALLSFLLVATPTTGVAAQAERRVTMQVVDLAGGRAYLDAGEDQGIAVGTTVRIGNQDFEVLAVTRTSCVVALAEASIELGSTASALVVPTSSVATEARRAEVVPIEDLRARWTPPIAPATTQQPAYVPLGVTSAERRARFLLASTTSAYLPLGGGTALIREQLRGRVHAEPIRNVPFAIDADATLQLYAARDLDTLPGGSSRPLLRVQRLEMSYGREQDFFVGLGRLWNAAQGVGMLDGVRVRAPAVRGFSLGAFGGLAPRLFDNVPSLDAARFGIEAGYRNVEHRLRPSLDVVVQGSFFEGRVDERRLGAFASLSPGSGRFGGYAVVDLHDRDNPWMNGVIEISSAGASASLRKGRWEGGLRLDYRRPDRSRFLASQLPVSWLCGGLGSAAVACDTRHDGRTFASGDTSVRVSGRTVLAAGGSFVHTPAAQTYQGSGFLQLRVAGIADTGRIAVTTSAYGGSLLLSYAVALEGGMALLDGLLDVTVHYRPALNFYAAEIRPGVDHLVGTNLRFDPGHAVTAALSFDAFAGHDVHAILAQATLAYRPDLR